MSWYKFICYAVMAFLMSACVTKTGDYHRIAHNGSFAADLSIAADDAQDEDGNLTILSLNIAHGRNQSINQLLVKDEDLKRNIITIARLIKSVDADVVALQEVDGPSSWSGNFDHLELLAREANYPWYYRAKHAESWLFSYGTAILSRLPVREIMQYTFDPSPPTLNKGFLLATVNWARDSENEEDVAIDIASVHLDFSRHRVREKQIAELSGALRGRENPLILAGDFNSDWFAEESTVRRLAEETKMSAFRPMSRELPTYKSDHRYDWILISSELAYVSYQVLPDPVSDHLAVVAEISLIAPSGRK